MKPNEHKDMAKGTQVRKTLSIAVCVLGGLGTLLFLTRLSAWGFGTGLVALTSLAYAQAASVPSMPVDTHPDPDVTRAAESYRKAVLAGDVSAVVALFRNDAVEMPAFQPPVAGHAALEHFYREMFNGPTKVTGFTFTHMETATQGDVAYDVGSYKRSMTSPGGPVDAVGSYIVILKRNAGEWRIAYLTYTCDCQPPRSH